MKSMNALSASCILNKLTEQVEALDSFLRYINGEQDWEHESEVLQDLRDEVDQRKKAIELVLQDIHIEIDI